MENTYLDATVVNNILNTKDVDKLIRFSSAFTRYYRNKPWETPLVKVEDFVGKAEIFSSKILSTKFPHSSPYHRDRSYSVEHSGHRKFFDYFPSLKFDFDGFIVAGGSATSRCYVNSSCHYEPIINQDADIFVLKTTEKECNAVEKNIENRIKAAGERGFLTIKNLYSTTLIGTREEDMEDGEKIQIIKRGYRNAAQVLAMFDLPSCKFGFDGNDFFCTLDGAIALHLGINIVDSEVASPSFWSRLKKYQGRGFIIICPPLEIQNIKTIKLSGVTLETFDDYKSTPFSVTADLKDKEISDYCDITINLKAHSSLILQSAIKHDAKGIYLLRKEGNLKYFTLDSDNFLRFNVYGYLLKILYTDWFNTRARTALRCEKKFKFYWGEIFYPKALELRAKIQAIVYEDSFDPSILNILIGMDLDMCHLNISECFTDYHELIKERAKELQDRIDNAYEEIKKEKWILENPGQQFRGAFNPTIVTPREFWSDVSAKKHQSWKPFSTVFKREQKFTLLCIRKYYPTSFPGFLPKDVFLELVKVGGYIDQEYLRDVFSTGNLNKSTGEQLQSHDYWSEDWW